ncbi:MAG: hypothetical protein J3K34DRAFT_268835 [Monoraphidium minutum]|nr:MAG: hypothetical protein J3K34DRAFT_268835 [Monoraphidium minutum]
MGRDQTAAMDVDAWKAFGGTVEGKVYVSPGGERLKSWKAAAKVMADGKKDAPASGKKRAADAEADGAAAGAKAAGGKENKGKKTPVAKKAKAAATPAKDGPDAMATDAPDAAAPAPAPKDDDTSAPVGSGRRVAQGVQYKDGESARARKADMIVAEEEPEAESEADGIRETQGERPSSTRRLLHFTITDKAGIVQPLERLGLANQQLFATGAIYPEEGEVKKPAGRSVASFGPIKSWTLTPPSGAATGPVIRVTTQLGCYVLSRPLPAYKKVWTELSAQATLTAEVMLAVDPAVGGNAAATFDEVVSRLARQKAIYKGYASVREALLLNGRFVLQTLEAADAQRRGVAAGAKDKGKGAAGATEWAFYKGLEAELAKGPVAVGTLMTAGGGIKISDGNDAAAPAAPANDAMAADEEMARRLQAQMDAQAYSGGGNRGRGTPGGAANAYIKINEEEIADDYPMPKQYDKEEDEEDELALLWDEELAQLDPDALPRRLVTDFSVYNAEVRRTRACVCVCVRCFLLSGFLSQQKGNTGLALRCS